MLDIELLPKSKPEPVRRLEVFTGEPARVDGGAKDADCRRDLCERQCRQLRVGTD
jgi:hypothetical protein